MRQLVTDDAMERPANLRQSQRVRRGAVEREIDVAVGLEDFPDAIAYFRSHIVFAVGWSSALICNLQSG